jgi:hypothetical protein
LNTKLLNFQTTIDGFGVPNPHSGNNGFSEKENQKFPLNEDLPIMFNSNLNLVQKNNSGGFFSQSLVSTQLSNVSKENKGGDN